MMPLNVIVVQALWAFVVRRYTAVRHTFRPRADVLTKSDVDLVMLQQSLRYLEPSVWSLRPRKQI
jgi:hypothetical protein